MLDSNQHFRLHAGTLPLDQQSIKMPACFDLFKDSRRMLAETQVYGGPEGNRTPDLKLARLALSQLSYRPIFRCGCAVRTLWKIICLGILSIPIGPGERTRTSNASRHQGLNLAAIPIRLHPHIGRIVPRRIKCVFVYSEVNALSKRLR